MKLTFRTVTVLAVVLATCVAPIALATDTKAVPGAICKPEDPDANYSITGARIYNDDVTYDEYFVCPLIDDVNRFGTSPVTDIEVTVLDQHYYDNVSCTFYSFQQNGTSGSFATDSSSGSSASPVTLDSFYTASMYTYTKGVMLVRCSVPDIYSGNESGIHTIWYIEN